MWVSQFEKFREYRNLDQYGPYKNFAAYIENRSGYIKNEKLVILCLIASRDPNGALMKDPNENFLKLEDQGYQLVFSKVSSIQDINNAIHSIESKIHVLFIKAHGSPTSLSLSIEHSISAQNLEQIEFNHLSPDSVVVLCSCSTGKMNEKEKSIAEKMSMIFHRTVIAPKGSCTSDSFYVDPKNITNSSWRKIRFKRSTFRMKQSELVFIDIAVQIIFRALFFFSITRIRSEEVDFTVRFFPNES